LQFKLGPPSAVQETLNGDEIEFDTIEVH